MVDVPADLLPDEPVTIGAFAEPHPSNPDYTLVQGLESGEWGVVETVSGYSVTGNDDVRGAYHVDLSKGICKVSSGEYPPCHSSGECEHIKAVKIARQSGMVR